MATANALIDETLDLFLQPNRGSANQLAADVDAVATTWTFVYELAGIAAGQLIECDTELVLVMQVTGQSATVVRAQRGSTAAAHTAQTLVSVAPKLSRYAVFRSLNEELYALHGAGLYRMLTVELTYNPAIQGYNLTGVTDVTDVYAVSYDTFGASQNWAEIPGSQWRLVRNAETDDFASGLAIILYHGGNPGRQLRVAYKAPFGQFTTTASTTVSVGLEESQVDLLPLGVLQRVGSTREWSRNFLYAQGDTRRANEVPMGSMIAAARATAQYRQERLTQEILKLDTRYPETKR